MYFVFDMILAAVDLIYQPKKAFKKVESKFDTTTGEDCLITHRLYYYWHLFLDRHSLFYICTLHIIVHNTYDNKRHIGTMYVAHL